MTELGEFIDRLAGAAFCVAIAVIGVAVLEAAAWLVSWFFRRVD